jgi:hypothetical protein
VECGGGDAAAFHDLRKDQQQLRIYHAVLPTSV